MNNTDNETAKRKIRIEKKMLPAKQKKKISTTTVEQCTVFGQQNVDIYIYIQINIHICICNHIYLTKNSNWNQAEAAKGVPAVDLEEEDLKRRWNGGGRGGGGRGGMTGKDDMKGPKEN